ncbi:two component transcriptional regulator, LytTR family [Chitinophaga sp. CF118]|uniref:LytR/AlgR family response regulator transcription factor n=1 Tax=Chitinophaga sp. CF118 TaxID=1884367 RepID=UPI0008E2D7D4|nr:LytTR family DNA-binding domain-containing protein [Chitinophaga sp. CF118]SFD86884.1 two component transcriptional regulator, LytTR family [Chitinophaga sp. CF118]
MLHCIAIDDEPLSLDILKAYSEPLNNITLACTFTSTTLARQYLDNNTVDLIFLDIEMADIDGLSFYRSLNTKPMVIFTTAYSSYAVQGFEIAALDYLLKPISIERFLQAIQKACHLMAFHQHIMHTNTSFLSVRSEYQTKKIALSEILYIEGLNNHVKIYTDSSPKPILSMMSMKEILSKLSGRRFARIHRSYIIDLSKVTSYNSRHIFIENKQFPIGDTYRNVTKHLIEPSDGSPLF